MLYLLYNGVVSTVNVFKAFDTLDIIHNNRIIPKYNH